MLLGQWQIGFCLQDQNVVRVSHVAMTYRYSTY